MTIALIVGIVFTLAGIGALMSALRKYRLRRHILDMPTESPGGVSLGLSEISGRAEPASDPLRAPLEDRPCLVYHYALFRKTKSDDGKRWNAEQAGTHGVSFFLEGDGGRVLVDPTDAEIHLPTTSRRHRFKPQSSSSIYWDDEQDPPSDVEAFMDRCEDLSDYRVDPLRSQTVHKTISKWTSGSGAEQWAFRHECLFPGDDTYVLGHAHPPSDVENAPEDVTAVIRAPDDPSGLWSKAYDSVYIISNQSEEDVLADRLSLARWHFGMGLVILGIGFLALYFPLMAYLQ